MPDLFYVLTRIFNDTNIKVFCKPLVTVRNALPSLKDPLDVNLRKGVIYRIPCADCNSCYVGETGRCFSTRL